MRIDLKSGSWIIGDCLEEMASLPDASVDLILCDLPYEATQNDWDKTIPLAPLWEQYWRLIKPGRAIVLTAMQPFSSRLVMHQFQNFKYSWVWNKSHASNPMNAKKRPMQKHEEVLVFAKGRLPIYFPQMTKSEGFRSRRGAKTGVSANSDNYGSRSNQDYIIATEKYPTTDLYFNQGARRHSIHPTQKPVDLFKYMISTYTIAGDLVLDNAAGSGTTAIAAMGLSRRYVCIENNEEYSLKAIERIRNGERE
jgi:DNA modification methylase